MKKVIFGICFVCLAILSVTFFYRPKIKVSVVVPVYNNEKYVYECLRNLSKQQLKEIEFIVIDDGSLDGSLELIKKFQRRDKRFRVYTQKNMGVGKTRNRGIDLARGEYIGFVDSDDFVSEDYFLKLYAKAKKYDADVAVMQNVVKFEDGREEKSSTFGIDYTKNNIMVVDDISDEVGEIAQQWDKIYKRSFLEKYNIRCYEKRLWFEDEWFGSIVAMYAKKIAFETDVIYYYRYNPYGITQSFLVNEKTFNEGLGLYDNLIEKVKHTSFEEKKKKMLLEKLENKKKWYVDTYKEKMK